MNNSIKPTEEKPWYIKNAALPILEKGDKIKLYGEKTIVEGFTASYNDAIGEYEIIIHTKGRADPFRRSLDFIEVSKPENVESFEYRKLMSSPISVPSGGERPTDEQLKKDKEGWEKAQGFVCKEAVDYAITNYSGTVTSDYVMSVAAYSYHRGKFAESPLPVPRTPIDPEPLTAKLRNKLTPLFNLAEMCKGNRPISSLIDKESKVAVDNLQPIRDLISQIELGVPRTEESQELEEFADWLDKERNSRSQIWNDMQIWSHEIAFKMTLKEFRKSKLTRL